MSSEKNAPRYFMHKYWGKKPAFGISPLIDKYTNPGDIMVYSVARRILKIVM